MPGWRWTITDPAAGTLTFLVNPNAGGSLARKRNFTYQNTAAPGGRTLVFEGRRDVQVYEVSGTLLSQAEYEFLDGLVDIANQVQITDDLGRTFWVVFNEFTPTRVRAATAPWKHTYNLKAVVVDAP